MGGRGSLSPNKHTMYNKATIKAVMNAQGIRVHGLNTVDNKGLSVVVEALETLNNLQKKHGKYVDNIVIGAIRDSDFSFNENYKFNDKVRLPNTLIIPKKTVQGGKIDLEREVKYANKNRIVVAKNVKEMIYHEYGHALHQALKVNNPNSYRELERRFSKLMKNPEARVEISEYAKTKKYKKRSQATEYVAESVVHILRGTRPRKGRDMVDLVHIHLSSIPNSNIRLYSEYTAPPKPKKNKKPRGTSTRSSSRNRR